MKHITTTLLICLIGYNIAAFCSELPLNSYLLEDTIAATREKEKIAADFKKKDMEKICGWMHKTEKKSESHRLFLKALDNSAVSKNEKKISKTEFYNFLSYLETERPDIFRLEVELLESNKKAIKELQKNHFKCEVKYNKKYFNANDDRFESSVLMTWFNPSFTNRAISKTPMISSNNNQFRKILYLDFITKNDAKSADINMLKNFYKKISKTKQIDLVENEINNVFINASGYFVIIDEETIVGVIQFCQLNRLSYKIEILIDPNFNYMVLADRLLKEFLNLAKTINILRCEIQIPSCHKIALKLLQKFDFKIEGKLENCFIVLNENTLESKYALAWQNPNFNLREYKSTLSNKPDSLKLFS